MTIEKDELLKLLLKKKGIHLEKAASIPPRAEALPIPLSFAQQRLWFLNKLEGVSIAYNLTTALHLIGYLHITALRQTVAEIVRRHEILRTTFPILGDTPIQAIATTEASKITIDIPLIDLRSHSEAEQLQEVQQWANKEAVHSFDLSKGPLLRVTLLWLNEQSHVLLVNMHHIISDGWSTGVFVREFAALYKAFSSGMPSPLPELDIQYADFALWQREWLSGTLLQTQLDYWRQQLAGIPPLLELPTDRPRPPVQTFRGGIEDFQLDRDLTQKLVSLSHKSGVTLFMTLLTAFVILLSRYSGQEDIVVGSPVANRNRKEIDSLIGFFVNTLVLRVNLQGNPTFVELLSQVKQVALNAYAHQDLPFEKLVELQPERSLSYNPLFQVLFSLQNAAVENLELPGLTLIPLKTDHVTAQFDLTLGMEETPEGLIGHWEYNSDLFDATTITPMTEHLRRLLSGIVAHSEARIWELPLLSQAEQHQLLVEWNDTQSEYPQQQCLHQLFEAQVEKTPDAVAVVFEKQQLTYRELNVRANQLAHYLQSLGVRPEVLVGICVERSIEMVVGLLGIFKAGGAYLPLDGRLPQERLAYMLSNAQASLLLTQQHLKAKFSEATRLVCLEEDWFAIASQSEENPISGVDAKSLAYVIYTSGSTGTPKGTAIAHVCVVNYLTWCTQAYEVASGCGALVHSSLAFDATITSLFSPLLVGQKVVLLPEKNEIEALAQSIGSQKDYSLVKITPAHLDILSQLLTPNQNPIQTKALIVGGEALSEKSLSFWRNYAPHTRVFNEYGPTETVVGCCVYEVTHYTSGSGGVPIGRPIANTQLYILDQYLQPVPIGVRGELYIGGDGVARGYLNATELTEEKFIPNPFDNSKVKSEPALQEGFPPQATGAREAYPKDSPRRGQKSKLYKTGDLARYLPDGNIEFLGRIDSQVKIRGFRIELGEIEAVLKRHPQVQETAVILLENQADDKQLVAYVVPDQKFVSTEELRSFLKEKLPEYMLPSVFVLLDSLPLTSNGKIDRHALPVPDTTSRNSENGNLVLPRTPTEEILSAIWARVLGLSVVSIYDNFFELGGDSIKAIQVVSRLAQHNFKLKEQQLFQFRTIAELATEVIPISHQADQGLISGSVPLTPIQCWFFLTYPGNKHYFNQSLMLATPSRLNLNALHDVIRQIQLHHDALRLRFKCINGNFVQEYGGADDTPSFEIVDLVGRVDAISQLEAESNRVQASMNIERGPLIRFILFHLDNGDRLLMVAHHLVIDTVSWRILLEDLSTGYEQACGGSEIKFPAKTDSYQRWSTALQEYSTSYALQEEQEYWQKLANTKVDWITVDIPQAENLVRDSSTLNFTLTPEETNALLTEVHHPYNTEINDILLTALAQGLNRWCGGQRFLIDLDSHGRVDEIDGVDISRTVGWFTSLYPVLLDLATQTDIGYQIKFIKETLRRVHRKGIGYGILRYLMPTQGEQNSLMQVQPTILFNYLGRIDEDINFSLFDLAQESCGHLIDLSSQRSHELEFSGFVYHQQMSLSVTFCATRFQQHTIQNLLDHYQQALKAIIQHCQQQKNREMTPSDFTYGNLSLEEFEDIFATDD